MLTFDGIGRACREEGVTLGGLQQAQNGLSQGQATGQLHVLDRNIEQLRGPLEKGIAPCQVNGAI